MLLSSFDEDGKEITLATPASIEVTVEAESLSVFW